MKNILITGANGKIAQAVISKLLQGNNKLFLFSRNKNNLLETYSGYTNVFTYDYSDLDIFEEELDIVLHCAFERSENEEELLKSKILAQRVFSVAKQTNCKRVINLSSQAVYKMNGLNAPTESDSVEAFDLYGKTKVVCEKILENTLPSNRIVNIRLTALSGVNYPSHLLYKFISNALKNNEIKIVGGSQNFAFMNFKDAIEAILILFNLDIQPEYSTYNLGNNEQYNIIEIAQQIQKELNVKGYDIKITVDKKDINLNVQLNSERFMKEFNWSPKYKLIDTIKEIIESLIDNE